LSRVEVFAGGDELVEAAARSALADLEAAIDDYETCTWVLTGGGTPLPAYRRLTRPDLRDSVEWGRVTVAMGDERAVPPDHPDSNWGQASEAMLDHVPIPEEQRLRVRGELGADRAAAEYEQALASLPRHRRPLGGARGGSETGSGRSATGGRAARGSAAARSGAGPGGPVAAGSTPGGLRVGIDPPRLDLVWLGVGPDGHCLSLFPGFPELEVVDRAVVPVHGAPKPPPDRVSLTLAALAGADRLVVLVSGADKADAVAKARAGDAGLPITRAVTTVQDAGGSVTWLLDRAAAGS
jgi:6-phosphogluconolactonase